MKKSTVNTSLVIIHTNPANAGTITKRTGKHLSMKKASLNPKLLVTYFIGTKSVKGTNIKNDI